jgi:hypothetical protein
VIWDESVVTMTSSTAAISTSFQLLIKFLKEDGEHLPALFSMLVKFIKEDGEHLPALFPRTSARACKVSASMAARRFIITSSRPRWSCTNAQKNAGE